jgi:hypothetical protein
LFLYAGGFKLVLPLATLAKFSPLPGAFLKFIGICEMAGALGLVLPGMFRIRRWLTRLAAGGLLVIMICAVTVTVLTQGPGPAAVPFVLGVILAALIRGRRTWAVAPGRLFQNPSPWTPQLTAR